VASATTGSADDESAIRASDSGTTDSPCFHCGLPLPEHSAVPPLEVLGEAREFCCHGCEAVCKAIVDAGLDDYYQHRDTDTAADRQVVPEILQHLDLYDRPDIQKNFVRAGTDGGNDGDWCEASLLLEDIRCPACLWLNERHLRSLPGVLDVSLDDLTHRARVRWQPEHIQLSEILGAIAAIGYIAHPYDSDRSDALQQLRQQRSVERLIFAGAAGMIAMNFSLATYLMPIEMVDGQLPLWVTIGRWTNLLVSLLLLAYPGQEFFLSAWRDLKRSKVGMDLPIVLGLSAAFLGSLHATIVGRGEVYFDSIAMFVFLLLLARRWELKGKIQAANQLERISHSSPTTATRLDADGKHEQVAAIDLQIGDRIQLLPGEALAVDGLLLQGSSSFDEALLTGEATPVLRRPGDNVIAGSVNGDQLVVVEVHHAGIAALKPGVRLGGIDDAIINPICEQHGLLENRTFGTGHSFGIMGYWYGRDELGEIRPYNDYVLQPNMVMSMEPMISVDGIGGFKHADMFLITENGNEPLTRFRNDVIVID